MRVKKLLASGLVGLTLGVGISKGVTKIMEKKPEPIKRYVEVLEEPRANLLEKIAATGLLLYLPSVAIGIPIRIIAKRIKEAPDVDDEETKKRVLSRIMKKYQSDEERTEERVEPIKKSKKPSLKRKVFGSIGSAAIVTLGMEYLFRKLPSYLVNSTIYNYNAFQTFLSTLVASYMVLTFINSNIFNDIKEESIKDYLARKKSNSSEISKIHSAVNKRIGLSFISSIFKTAFEASVLGYAFYKGGYWNAVMVSGINTLYDKLLNPVYNKLTKKPKGSKEQDQCTPPTASEIEE